MRIRTIKAEFWTNEGLCSCSLEAHVVAAGLLNWADDEGYFLANPALIAGALFPLRFAEPSVTVHGALTELSREGWIVLGKLVDGRAAGYIPNFTKHQTISRPSPSRLGPIFAAFSEDSMSTHGVRMEDSIGKGRERKGKDLPPSEEARADALALEAPVEKKERKKRDVPPAMRELPQAATERMAKLIKDGKATDAYPNDLLDLYNHYAAESRQATGRDAPGDVEVVPADTATRGYSSKRFDLCVSELIDKGFTFDDLRVAISAEFRDAAAVAKWGAHWKGILWDEGMLQRALSKAAPKDDGPFYPKARDVLRALEQR